MKRGKRSQAKILTTVLIIMFAVIAVTIVFNVVKPIVTEKSEDIETGFGNYIEELFGKNNEESVKKIKDENQKEVIGEADVLETNSYIVQFEDEPVLKEKIKLEKQAKENEDAGFFTQTFSIMPEDVPEETKKYSKKLEENNENIINEIKSKISKKKVKNKFKNVFNGVSLSLTDEEIEDIKKISGVKSIYRDLIVEANLMDSVPLINTDDVWQLDANGNDCVVSGEPCLTGEGISIAILDTGIDYTHVDFGGWSFEELFPINGEEIIPQGYSGFYSQAMYGDKIIYYNSTGIFMYDILTRENIFVKAINDNSGPRVAIYEDKIVFSINNIENSGLYVCDLAGYTGDILIWCDTDISLGGGLKKISFEEDIDPYDTGILKFHYGNIDVYDNIVVWEEKIFINPGYDHSTYMYDLLTDTKTQITLGNYNHGVHGYAPRVYGNKIIYGTRYPTKSLYMYDISTTQTTQIADSTLSYPSVGMYFLPYYPTGFDVYGDKIVWVDSRNGKEDIYKYEISLAQETQISDDNLGYKADFDIFNNKLIGRIFQNPVNSPGYYEHSDVYMWDINTGERTFLACRLKEEIRPRIYGDKIIWLERKDVNNIYLFDLSSDTNYCELTPPITFPTSKVIGGYDFFNNDNDPKDDNGHGTHVAGIAAGNGVLKGVAPDAKLYAYKVLDSGASGGSPEGFQSMVVAGTDRAVDPNEDGDFSDHVDIISMSIGLKCKQDYGGYIADCGPDDPASQAVDNVVNAGVIVVISAGNQGADGEGSIGSPGTARKAITVGATYKKDYEGIYWGDIDPRVDQMTSFSSIGPVIYNDETINKPDIVAPGAVICSSKFYPLDIFLDNGCLDDNHLLMSGTSMSAPMVAGAVALIKQAHPDWTPEQIETAIKSTAIDLGLDVNTQGAGRIDVQKAISIELCGPGDVNGDGFVGGDDLNIITTNWGMSDATREQGDLTDDGFVGGEDYSEVQTYWGQSTTSDCVPIGN